MKQSTMQGYLWGWSHYKEAEKPHVAPEPQVAYHWCRSFPGDTAVKSNITFHNSTIGGLMFQTETN